MTARGVQSILCHAPHHRACVGRIQTSAVDPIHLALVLRPDKRSRAAAARVEEIARSLGFDPTGSGSATVSVRIAPERFEQCFGARPKPVPPEPPGHRDAGAPGGHSFEETLPVPPELDELVESISVVPPARRL